MSRIQMSIAEDFRGETVVLLAMDEAGLEGFCETVLQAGKSIGHSGKLIHDGKVHEVIVQDTAATIELNEQGSTWRFSKAKLEEIAEKLGAMRSSTVPCHHYVDIASPTSTLVLSLGEYA